MDMKNIFHTFAWVALLVLAGCVTPPYTYATVEPPPPPPPTVVAPVTYSSGSSYVVPSYGPTWSTYEYRSYVPLVPPPSKHHGHHHQRNRHEPPPPTMRPMPKRPTPKPTVGSQGPRPIRNKPQPPSQMKRPPQPARKPVMAPKPPSKGFHSGGGKPGKGGKR